MAARLRPAAAAIATLATVLPWGLAGCFGGRADSADYAIDGALPTYNANTVVGAASGAPQAFARTLTGFSYRGPDGQTVSDRDFGTVTVVGRVPLILDYQISPAAVYSDGKPVTCDDLMLGWAAQSGRFPGFDAATRAGYADVAEVDCRPGEKRARVTFARDRNVVDPGQLFAATTLLPAHVIADRLGLGDGGVTQAIAGSNLDAVARIATEWNTTWNLAPGIDVRRFPSSGPYKLDSVTAAGAVVLVANDKWWGPKPVTPRITVWPRRADLQERLNRGDYDVVDVAAGSAGTLTIPPRFTRTERASGGVEQLIFGLGTVLGDPAARRALALCIPRDVIARDAGAAVADNRLAPATDDSITAAENGAAAEPFATADPGAARDALGGRPLAVRIGYQGPDPRLAAVVGTIARSCGPAGIAVTDAAADVTGPLALREGKVDALLASTGGATGSGSSGSSWVDAYQLISGNGNDLSGYANEKVDGVIGALAVTADPREVARLLGEGAPVLWADLPSLPLYRQHRILLTSAGTAGVTTNPTRWGAGWNMDRWELAR